MANSKVGGVLRWADPPSASLRRGRALFNVDAVVKDLKSKPGQSAVIVEDVSQSYAHSSPLIKKLKDLGVDITATKVNGNGKHVIYGRVAARRGPGRPRKESAAA